MFLMDANALIDANDYYYPIERIPQYWDWLLEMGNKGKIKVPSQIYDELTPSDETFKRWVNDKDTKKSLLLDEEVEMDALNRLLDEQYGTELTMADLTKIGKDPFLIYFAKADRQDRIVLSRENSAPKKQRANRKVPDICKALEIECITDHKMIRRLDFRIG